MGTVNKQDLYPPMPSLTRYKETPFPVMKKKIVESTVLDKEVNKKLHELTTAKLCIRLNTLQVGPLLIFIMPVNVVTPKCELLDIYSSTGGQINLIIILFNGYHFRKITVFMENIVHRVCEIVKLPDSNSQ